MGIQTKYFVPIHWRVTFMTVLNEGACPREYGFCVLPASLQVYPQICLTTELLLRRVAGLDDLISLMFLLNVKVLENMNVLPLWLYFTAVLDLLWMRYNVVRM